MNDNFGEESSSCRILNNAELAKALAGQKEVTQVHLLGRRASAEDIDYVRFLHEIHGMRFDSSLVFRVEKSLDVSLLAHVGPLQALSLIRGDISNADWSFLSNHRESLVFLCLRDNGIGSTGAGKLAAELQYLKEIKLLDLGYNPIRPEGAPKLAVSLGHLTQLTMLDLESDDIGLAGAAALGVSLRHLTQLKTLNLGSNRIWTTGVGNLAEPLGRLAQLTTLDLGSNSIDPPGAAKLAEPLGRLTQLTTLDLGWNSIGPRGAAKLAESLGRLTQLKALNLRNNDIGAAGAKELAGPLGQLTRLKTLDLESNNISTAGVKELAGSLGRLTQLMTLDLGNNKISAAGAKNLAEPLACLTQLTTLTLRGNSIGDEGLQALAQAYKKGVMQSLQRLSLAANEIHCVDEALLSTRDARSIFRAVLEGVAMPHARVMLVGMGGVGKSLLARRTFLDRLQQEGPHEETHDIVVLRPDECEWMPRIEPELDEPKVQTWVWDFAGQLVTHGVHESFLADDGRTVYVVVLAADREPDRASVKYDGNRLRYWLQMLRYAVGSVAPMIIVITRNDKWRARQRPRPVDSFLAWPELTPARALKDVELIDLSNRLNVSVINVVTDFSACDEAYPIREGLHRVIQDAVLRLGVVKEKRVPREFVPLKNLIDDRLPKHTLIAREEFDDWCAEVEIEGSALRDELLRMLHHMGSVIYWGRTKSERDQASRRDDYPREDQLLAPARRTPPGSLQSHVLNPTWFKTCVYAITRASEELMDGKPRVWLTAGEIDRIVTQASAALTPSSATHPAEGTVIREALRFIGVCWDDEARGKFLFPRGLPEKDWTEYLAWGGHRLTWDFLPEHCVAKLLVRLHQDGLVVSRKRGSYVHDRNATLITYPPGSGNQVLVSAIPEQGHVEIRYSPATQPEDRRSALQHLLVILQARELQGRPAEISKIAAENTRTQQAPTRTPELPSDRETDFQSSAGYPVVVALVDQAPRPPAAGQWKGTLLVDPDPTFVASFEVVSQFYQIGLCYQQPDAPSQKEIAKRFHVAPSTVSRWETDMRDLLNRKFPYSTIEALVTQKNGRKCELSAVGIEAMAWSEYCFPMLLELRKAIPG